jgi:hypothetical protein
VVVVIRNGSVASVPHDVDIPAAAFRHQPVAGVRLHHPAPPARTGGFLPRAPRRARAAAQDIVEIWGETVQTRDAHIAVREQLVENHLFQGLSGAACTPKDKFRSHVHRTAVLFDERSKRTVQRYSPFGLSFRAVPSDVATWQGRPHNRNMVSGRKEIRGKELPNES